MEQPQAEEDEAQMQARHRRELKELQGRITGKKKNATKKTRRGVNDECERLERDLRERHAAERAATTGGGDGGEGPAEDEDAADTPHRDESEPRLDDDDADDDLASAASALRLSATASDPASSPPRRKPRNRQRERLARRAAEQDSAARAAASEATSMPDHRAREDAAMRAAFAAHGLVEAPMAPDGHCLFAAVADQLRQRGVARLADPAYRAARAAAADYMLAHPHDFAPFLDEDLAAYAAKVRDTAEWGGQLELTALARSFGAEIRVLQDGRVDSVGDGEAKAPERTLWLAYYRHGYGLGEHYNSLRPKATP